MMKYYPGPTEAESARFREDFALVIAHVQATPDFAEWYERTLALRACRRRYPPRWPFHDLKSRQRQQMDNYRAELAWRRHRRGQIERHRARLLARGIAPEHLHRHPYKSPAQKREERERLCYIRHALRAGLPMPWELSRYE